MKQKKLLSLKFHNILSKYKKQACDETVLESVHSLCLNKIKTWPPSKKTMAALFATVDSFLFDRVLVETLISMGIRIDFSLGIDKLHIAGQTTFMYGKTVINFKLNHDLFETLFDQQPSASYSTGGRQCESIRACFLNIFFHEMCHIFIYMYRTVTETKKWTERSHGKMFSLLCKKVFLQNEVRHALIPGFRAWASTPKIRQESLKCQRMRKSMEYYDNGVWVTVKINSVRRIFASVTSKDGNYDVPISLLRPKKKK